jgi:transcriptional regulator with XRE-family HTH domain
MHNAAMSSDELKRLMSELRDVCRVPGRQQEVAKEMGVSAQVLSNWLTGIRSPSLRSFFKIREFLDRQK